MEPVNDHSTQTVAYCRACGRGLTPEQVQNHQGTVYCAEHMPHLATPPRSAPAPDGGANPYASPSVPPSQSSVSPGWAFVLGLIPGVGAIYNGQYAKGFVHALVTGVLFSLADHGARSTEALVQMLIPVWIFYMAFEAYHTAKKRMLGETVDEFSSIFPNSQIYSGFPVLPVLLIVLGVVFLLDNLNWLDLRALAPYVVPGLMIALGVFLLYARLKTNARMAQEVNHER